MEWRWPWSDDGKWKDQCSIGREEGIFQSGIYFFFSCCWKTRRELRRSDAVELQSDRTDKWAEQSRSCADSGAISRPLILSFKRRPTQDGGNTALWKDPAEVSLKPGGCLKRQYLSHSSCDHQEQSICEIWR